MLASILGVAPAHAEYLAWWRPEICSACAAAYAEYNRPIAVRFPTDATEAGMILRIRSLPAFEQTIQRLGRIATMGRQRLEAAVFGYHPK